MKGPFTKKAPPVAISGKLSDDRIKLFIDVERIADGELTRVKLVEALTEFIKPERLDTGVLDAIVHGINAGEKKIADRRVAKGIAPGEAANGKVVHLVRLYTGKAEVANGKTEDAGKEKQATDFRELQLFDNITKDQIVARIYPPRQGTPGEDAYGEVIPGPQGIEAKVVLDKTLAIQAAPTADATYQVIIAKQHGYLAFKDKVLAINPELVIKGDIDFHVGNVRFIGKIKVLGDVHPGFRVEAQDGIEIVGSSQRGTLVCSAGDILVKGPVFGGDGAKLVSGKIIKLSRAQEITIEAKAGIEIEKEARDCELLTQGAVLAPKGMIYGGKCLAVCGIEVKDLGNEGGIKTVVQLCADVEASSEYLDLNQHLEKHAQAIQMIKLHLGPLAENLGRIQLLKPEHRQKMEKLVAKLKELQVSQAKLLEKRQALMTSSKVSKTSRISYHGKVFTGVEVCAGTTEKFPIDAEIKGPGTIEYTWETKKFEVGQIKSIECNLAETPKVEVKNEQQKK